MTVRKFPFLAFSSSGIALSPLLELFSLYENQGFHLDVSAEFSRHETTCSPYLIDVAVYRDVETPQQIRPQRLEEILNLKHDPQLQLLEQSALLSFPCLGLELGSIGLPQGQGSCLKIADYGLKLSISCETYDLNIFEGRKIACAAKLPKGRQFLRQKCKSFYFCFLHHLGTCSERVLTVSQTWSTPSNHLQNTRKTEQNTSKGPNLATNFTHLNE